MVVDERHDLVPRDFARVLQPAAGVERQHRRVVAREKLAKQPVGVQPRRRLVLRMLEQQTSTIHPRLERVERLPLLLLQLREFLPQISDAILLGALVLLE